MHKVIQIRARNRAVSSGLFEQGSTSTNINIADIRNGDVIYAKFNISELKFPLAASAFHGYFSAVCDLYISTNQQRNDVKFTYIGKHDVYGRILSCTIWFTYYARLKCNEYDGVKRFELKRVTKVEPIKLHEDNFGLFISTTYTDISPFVLNTIVKDFSRTFNTPNFDCMLFFKRHKLDFSGYCRLLPILKYIPLFGDNIYRWNKVAKAEDGVDLIREEILLDLYNVIINGEKHFDLGLLNLDAVFDIFPSYTLVAEKLRALDHFCTSRRQTGSTHRIIDNSLEQGNNLLLLSESFKWTIDKPVYKELIKEGVLEVADNRIALKTDNETERDIVNSLKTIAEKYYSECEYQRARAFLQSEKCAELFKGLNEEQQNVTRQILLNPITVIAGIPGSGKTEIASNLHKFYQGAYFVMTFVGVMANSLKARVGKGNTMHSLIYQQKKLEQDETAAAKISKTAIAKLLKPATTVIMDEISNVCVRDLGVALKACVSKEITNPEDKAIKNITRIVFIGDLYQIAPIGLGKFSLDIARAIRNTHHLTTNVRVREDSRKLVDIDRILLNMPGGVPDEFAPTTQETEFAFCFDKNLNSSNPAKLFNASKVKEILPTVLDSILLNKNTAERTDAMNKISFLAFEKRDVSTIGDLLKRYSNNKEDFLLMVGRKFMVVDRKFNKRPICKILRGKKRSISAILQETGDDDGDDDECERDNIIYSAEVRNGEQYCVKSISRIRFMKNNTAFIVETNIPHIRGDYVDEQRHALLITTECGKTICIGKGFVATRYIVFGNGATVNKMQGSESEVVIGYMRPGISNNMCWNRSHLHVLLSRARTKLFLFAEQIDLFTVARRHPEDRDTLMEKKLQVVQSFISEKQALFNF